MENLFGLVKYVMDVNSHNRILYTRKRKGNKMGWLNSLNSVLDKHYEETIDRIYLKYFNYESPIPYQHISDQDRAALRQYESYAQSAGIQMSSRAHDLKCAVHEHSSTHHNGILLGPDGRKR